MVSLARSSPFQKLPEGAGGKYVEVCPERRRAKAKKAEPKGPGEGGSSQIKVLEHCGEFGVTLTEGP